MHTSHNVCTTGQLTATHALRKQIHIVISDNTIYKAHSHQKSFGQSFEAMVSCHSFTDSLDSVGTLRNNGREVTSEPFLLPLYIDNTVENPGSKLAIKSQKQKLSRV